MPRNILAFGASNSRKSINKKLATWASTQLDDVKINLIDLNDFEMPIYGIDREEKDGIPNEANLFRKHINKSDGIILSFAEHNGGFTVAFKNIFDWATRAGKNLWANKPMFLMATSPGKRGGKTVLGNAIGRFEFMGVGEIVHFSLPSFYDNFDIEKGIVNQDLLEEFNIQLKAFEKLM
ncbi:MAG: NAD(P)H-dependent oxidoreductase [Saprospiraceae bacterium]